tara:strand:+ start:392 stop:691 length:300 start_codon:yes stop_codon:yes gene_type:complete
LKPVAVDPENGIHNLQQLLYEAFPQCDSQNKKGNGFTPHLTLGQAPNPKVAKERIAQYNEMWKGWLGKEFTIEHVQVIRRGAEGPFEVHKAIELGTSKL